MRVFLAGGRSLVDGSIKPLKMLERSSVSWLGIQTESLPFDVDHLLFVNTNVRYLR